jgi:putative two-component system response regulator
VAESIRPSCLDDGSSHAATVLIISGDPGGRQAMGSVLRQEGLRCLEAATAAEGSAMVAREAVQVLVLDVGLPDADSIEWLGRYLRAAPDAAVIVATGRADSALAKSALRAGAIGLLAKPYRSEDVYTQVLGALAVRERHARTRHALRQAEQRVTELPQALCKRLLVATWQRDGETGEHVERIRRYAACLGGTLGMGRSRAIAIGEAAVLHDIGKVAVPDAILRKPGPLDPDERREMERHTVAGARILHDAGIPELALAATIARSHHERWDGTGYPDKSREDECPVEARLVAVVDVYDALSHERVYKPAWEERRVVAHFESHRGSHFEPSLVEALLDSLSTMNSIREEIRDAPESEARARAS